MMLIKSSLTLLASCVFATTLLAPTLAQEPASLNHANGNAVVVGGTPIMRVRFAAGGFSVEQRAAAIQERVNKLLGQGPILPAEITVEDRGLDAVVLVKGQLLFTADTSTARFNQATTRELANHWADGMRRVLPGLTEPKGTNTSP